MWFTVSAIASGGLAGLFLLAFFTSRANRRGVYAGIAACWIVTAWATLTMGDKRILNLGRFNFGWHDYMIGVVGHVALVGGRLYGQFAVRNQCRRRRAERKDRLALASTAKGPRDPCGGVTAPPPRASKALAARSSGRCARRAARGYVRPAGPARREAPIIRREDQRVRRFGPEQQARDRLGDNERSRAADHDAGQRQSQSLRDDPELNPRRARAERHADPDLLRLPRHRIRDHAVDAERRPAPGRMPRTRSPAASGSAAAKPRDRRSAEWRGTACGAGPD